MEVCVTGANSLRTNEETADRVAKFSSSLHFWEGLALKEQSQNLFQGETLHGRAPLSKEIRFSSVTRVCQSLQRGHDPPPSCHCPLTAFQKRNGFRMLLAEQRPPDSFRMTTNKDGAGVGGLTLLPSAPHFRNNNCLCLHPQALNVGDTIPVLACHSTEAGLWG